MEYRCVKCGFRIKTLFVQYSPGNIRLMKCENCRAVADEYIECEIILLIDLILHKPQAYRHLLYNVINPETVNLEGLLWKSTIGFVLLDAYRSLLLRRSNEDLSSSMNFNSLVWLCQKMLKDVVFGNIMFLCVFLLASRFCLNMSAGVPRFKDLLLAILISSYFKIFLVAMMIWKFPSSVIFIIDLLVLSSNIVALKVITKSAMNRIVGTCFVAHAVRFFVIEGLSLRSFR
ncbi:protein ARV 2-like isoform X2 [Mangifera indica]|uniref:protein ARV 2-like isoform X2 n=1 Tax=Mangifera indica TaxID=29780 RepID=UPI001CFB3805|nr:protein ARV 2-like isoform X2 [Mangifera indica]